MTSAKQSTKTQSRIFYQDGRVLEWDSDVAYLIWMAGPGTAIRVAGDNRPVYRWEYGVR